MKISDFDRFAFVVGAPRCGTTTISRLLRAHPQLSFSLVKEPHFFSQHDLRDSADQQLRKLVENEYLERFFEPSKARVGAEGSVSYLYTPEQMEPALRLWPDSRFIIAVRDPMAMLPSLHSRLIYTGDETITRFEDAWAAIPDRAAGRRIPRSCADPRWLRYEEAARFGTFVERMFAAVGRDRCLVVVFDDLVADTASQSTRIVDFLGLNPIEPAAPRPRRATYQVRYPWLQRLLKRPPEPLRPVLAGRHYRRRVVEDAAGDEGGGDAIEKMLSIRKKLLRWNRVPGVKRPVPLAVQQDIKARLQGEIGHLGELIGRDLSHWLTPREQE
ncbi:MAG: sulfotransferase [Pseudomonadota bacterium]|nr:sulfotransferase [Sphingomonas sp.]MDQ3477866.1 sulfotransferase [Pseudomonadota bacterium]